jgi:hypothetical protein
MVLLSNKEYIKRFIIPFNKHLPTSDEKAYKKYPGHNFVYNKHFVMRSQNIECNTMMIMPTSYPVFVKPEINLNGGNRGCFFVNNEQEFLEIREKYTNKNHRLIKGMFWSSVIQGEEASTDFIVQNGQIKYELDYKIKKIPGSIIGVETLISTKNKCPNKVRNWIFQHLGDFTGIVNLQYIGETIIEIGLRPDAGGRFLQWTKNKVLIENINYFAETGKWIDVPNHNLEFNDVYVVGCYKDFPIIYYLPAPVIELILKNNNVENWHYYIDIQKNGQKYINLVDEDREKLEKVKLLIENLMYFTNWIFILFFLSILILFSAKMLYNFTIPNEIYIFYGIVFTLYLSRFINPAKYTFNNEF